MLLCKVYNLVNFGATLLYYFIREYRSKVLCTMQVSALLQFVLTALLGSVDLVSWN